MIPSSNLSVSNRILQKQNSLLLFTEEAKGTNVNDKLLLPNSIRSLKRRTSLFEKSRDWARRLIALHRPRRSTLSNDKIHETFDQVNGKNQTTKPESSHNYQKNFDEDGYLSPMDLNIKLNHIAQENFLHQHSQLKLSTNDEHSIPISNSSSNIPQRVYRYHDPNIQNLSSQSTSQQQKPLMKTSFVSEFQKSLSIFDYIDFDEPKDLSKQNIDDHDEDDSLEGLKYLFNDEQKQQTQQQNSQGNSSRRILRRSTNASSISTDSGYSDVPIIPSKIIPVHLISCTLIPVNVTTPDSMNICCMACQCRPPSSLSSACLLNQHERTLPCHSHYFHQPLSHIDKIENAIHNPCTCNHKYYSTTAIYPSLSTSLGKPSKSKKKIDDNKDVQFKSQQHEEQNRPVKASRTNLMRLPDASDDFTSISRWYKPFLEREAVCDALQQADYGAFILRNSSTHSDCYALSIKVPKFTHESNIVHYLIEKTIVNNSPNYRIKGTSKQFPTLLSLLIHHSVMPEILPITLNLNESFAI